MLPTEEKATDKPFSAGVTLCNNNQLRIGNPVGGTESRQHLYITSDEEIRESDWMINKNRDTLYQCDAIGVKHDLKNWNKVVATTNSQLLVYCDSVVGYKGLEEQEADRCFPLPQVDQSFISRYMSEYNKGNKIEKIEVEYEKYDHDEEWSEIGGAYETCRERLKINPDNTINIKPIKESWSREEVVEILHRFRKETYNGYSAQKWINQNL